MKHKIYTTPAAQTVLNSDKKYKWVHLWTGKEVPPTSGGSFNHLINDILKQNLDHLLICQYSAESYRLAESSKASIIYVEFKSKVTFKSRMKHRLTGAHPINYEDFLKKSFDVIEKIKCDNIMIWGTPLYLSKLRAAFPKKTIVYNQRYFEHAYDIANQYDYCDILLTNTIGASKLAFDMNYSVTPLILTIPNGVEIDTFTPVNRDEKNELKTSLGIEPNKFVNVFPSKLHPYRGISYLLNWIKYFEKENPKIHFLVVGDWATKTLKGIYKELDPYLHKTELVTWIKSIPRRDIPIIYKSADVSLMPGVLRDGMSMSAIESLSSGLPVIATQRGSYSEIIKPDYNGILCKPENLFIEGICSIEKLFSNPELLRAMSLNAREYAIKRLSRQKLLANYKFFFKGEYTKIDNDLSLP